VELRTVARRLREMDEPRTALLFRRELRAAAAPMVPAVRRSIQAIPAKTGSVRRQGGSLRASMQRATKLYVRTSGRLTGVVIMVNGQLMPAGMRSLPAYEEGTKPRWRHPVFGHTDRWVAQAPHPYFYNTVRPMGVVARVAVGRAMSRVSEDITGGRRAF
jgi:hypothetical protein